MNEILQMLSGGTLQSDGRASEVADLVARNPRLLSKLADGLRQPNDVVRARAAHALERISRTQPDKILPYLSECLGLGIQDGVPMVKWHVAMIFANLKLPEGQVGNVITALRRMLKDSSVFVKTWTIVSLTILGRRHKDHAKDIMCQLRPLRRDPSIAVRTKVRDALKVLRDESEPIPAGWIKAR